MFTTFSSLSSIFEIFIIKVPPSPQKFEWRLHTRGGDRVATFMSTSVRPVWCCACLRRSAYLQDRGLNGVKPLVPLDIHKKEARYINLVGGKFIQFYNLSRGKKKNGNFCDISLRWLYVTLIMAHRHQKVKFKVLNFYTLHGAFSWGLQTPNVETKAKVRRDSVLSQHKWNSNPLA